ncbi:enoyl-CoA hydratase-related protein [Conexibacter sp. DBS9H8]|uniref:enoyl-CoA hydratase-related protein n=1 Tax=Conexibacter sp. DBS9H8 TaxID=2937801 RepID=UPI00200CC5A1|nr:enoyl-CoA hydratase-related protein [Conexibacter sp. DBS9H8]
MGADFETVTLESRDGVVTLTLNRPEALNAWDAQLGHDLAAALAGVAADPEARALLICGAGRAFSSGADLRSEMPLTADGKPDLYGRLHDLYNPVILAVRRLGIPVIAAINGAAVGVGASLALACDLIVCGQSAYFLLAFANIGLSVDGGASTLLAGRVGYTRAVELAMLADRLSAAEALGWGLVNRVVPDTELTDTATALARRLSAGPPGAYAAIKTLLDDACFPGLERQLEREAVLQQERGESADFVEGVSAFLERRPARFRGE